MPFSVVLDTCVLYPAYLRDTLLRLAEADLFRPLWSLDIKDELSRHLTERAGSTAARNVLERMTVAFPAATITDHEPLITTMQNDPKDRHVLAAAVRAAASAVVTFNQNDFPRTATDPLAIDVIHPDAFLLDLLDLSPSVALQSLRQQAQGYRKPSMRLEELTAALARCGCPRSADDLLRRAERRTE